MRENKQSSVYLILSAAALGIALLAAFIMFGREWMISLREHGADGSPQAWIGWSYFQQNWESISFQWAVLNTIRFNFLFAFFAFILAVLIGYGLRSLPSKFHTASVMLLLIIVFLPAEVYGWWWLHHLPEELVFQGNWMILLHPLLSAIKYLGIPVAVIYALAHYRPEDRWLPFKGAGLFAFSILAFIGTGLFSLSNYFYNPNLAQAMHSLETYVFRGGLAEDRYGMHAALNITSTLLSAASLLIMIVPIWLLLRITFQPTRQPTNQPAATQSSAPIPQELASQQKDSHLWNSSTIAHPAMVHHSISALIAFAVFALIYFVPSWIRGLPMWPEPFHGQIQLGLPILRYLGVSLLIALGSVLIACAIAGVFRSNHKLLLWSSSAVLAIITLLTLRTRTMAEYFTVMDWGLLNSTGAIWVATVFSTSAIWALAALWRIEHSLTITAVLTALGGLLLIQAALHYNNLQPSLMYISDPANFSPVMMFRQIARVPSSAEMFAEQASLQGGIVTLGFLVSMPAVLLYLAAHLLVPGRRLLLMIAGGMKQ